MQIKNRTTRRGDLVQKGMKLCHQNRRILLMAIGEIVYFDAVVIAAGTAWSSFLAGRTADVLYTAILAEWDTWRTQPPAGR